MIAGRELIDTLDAVRRYDFAARDLPGHGLKAVARHLGLAGAGPRVHRGRRRSTPPGAATRRACAATRCDDVRGGGRAGAAAGRRGLRAGAHGAAPLRAPGRRRAGHGRDRSAAGARLPARRRGAARARAGRRHAAQRRRAPPVRHRRGAARREGRRRQPVSVADARSTASGRRATVSARCWRWWTGWWSSGWRPRRARQAAPPARRSATRTRRCRPR